MKIGVFRRVGGDGPYWVVEVDGKTLQDTHGFMRSFATRKLAVDAGTQAVAYAERARLDRRSFNQEDAAMLLEFVLKQRESALSHAQIKYPAFPEMAAELRDRANAIGRALVALGVEGVPEPLVLP